MHFSGRLQIEADPRNWVKTDLNLSQGRLELVSGGDVLGSWSTSQVKAERVEGDKFQLHLGDDRLIFAADDALAFSYEALPVLAKKSVLAAAGGLRGKLRKGLAAPERPVPADVPIYVERPAPPEADDSSLESDPQEVAPPRKLRDLIQSAVEPVAPPDAGGSIVESDAEEVAPTRKLRDLIQAAVKNNAAGGPMPAATDQRGPESSAPARDSAEDDSPSYAPAQIFQKQDEPSTVVPEVDDDEPEFSAGGSVPELPQVPADAPPKPVFDLSPRFATPAPTHPIEARPPGILSEGGARFQSGETLGERQAGSFGWAPHLEDRDSPDLPEQPAPRSSILDGLVDRVRNAELSPAQIGAVTDLIRALADAIEDRAPKV